MNIEPSISAFPSSDAETLAPLEAESQVKTAPGANGHAPVIGVVAMMAVALPLVLAWQGDPCAASLPRRGAASGPQHPTAIVWNVNFDLARQIALATNKGMMIAFYVEDCALCQQMDREVYARAPIIAAAQSVVALQINGEAQPQLTSRYAILKYPTIVWTDAMGNEKHRFEGAASGFELYQAMEQSHEEFGAARHNN